MSVMLANRYRRARKQHICSYWPFKDEDPLNEHWIERGEMYRVATYIGDDGPYTWKSCAYHDAVATDMFRVGWYPDGAGPHDMSEHLYEMWGDAERSFLMGIAFIVEFDSHHEFPGEK